MASFSDDFTGAAGALLRQRTGWSYAGAAATQDRGTISNNRAKVGGSGGASTHYGYVRDLADANHAVEAKFLRNAGVGPCLYARWVNENNFIGVRNNGTNVELIKRIGGTISTVASVAAGLAVGDTVRIETRGTTVKLFRNGTQIGTTAGYAVSDGALSGATKVGLGGEGAVGSIEAFDDIAGQGLTPVALAPASARSVGSADAGKVSARFRLMAAKARDATSSDPGAVIWKVKLRPAKARDAASSDAGRVTPRARLTPGKGRSAASSDAGRVRWRGLLAVAKARLAPRGGVAGLAIRLRLTPRKARDGVSSDAAAVGWRGAVRGADGRSAVRGLAAGLSVRFALAVAAARQRVSSDAAGLSGHARTGLAAARGRSSGRGDPAGLAIRLRVSGRRGAHGLRADAVTVGWRGLLAAADGRSGMRGAARLRPPLGPPGIGEVMAVGAEAAMSVWGEVRVLAATPDGSMTV